MKLGSSGENGCIESFNGKLGNTLLNQEIFTTLVQVKMIILAWRNEYSQIKPQSSLYYRSPGREAIVPVVMLMELT